MAALKDLRLCAQHVHFRPLLVSSKQHWNARVHCNCVRTRAFCPVFTNVLHPRRRLLHFAPTEKTVHGDTVGFMVMGLAVGGRWSLGTVLGGCP